VASTTSVAATRPSWGSFSWSSFSYGGSQLETWLDFFLSWILSLSTSATFLVFFVLKLLFQFRFGFFIDEISGEETNM
jgi:hypothetical protein